MRSISTPSRLANGRAYGERRVRQSAMILGGTWLFVSITGCIEDPYLNEACEAAADKCEDTITYAECVDDSITTLDANPEYAEALSECLDSSACDELEACITPG